MTFYYLSFCDPTLPAGLQFLGATVIEAACIEAVAPVAWASGRNPGGEIAIVELPFSSRAESPETGWKYFDRFVPREEVLADEGREDSSPTNIEGDEDLRQATVCSACNER